MAIFPLTIKPKNNYHYGGIAFRGTSKWRGDRLHAACDLVVPAGTPVLAVTGGYVTSVPTSDFHLGTYTITIKHNTFIVRYGEVSFERMVKEGDTVYEGQQIGTVGLNTNGGAMLHFEMYRGDTSGFLSQKGNDSNYKYVKPGNFQRRKDLLDPTPFLDSWQLFTDWGSYVCEDPSTWSE